MNKFVALSTLAALLASAVAPAAALAQTTDSVSIDPVTNGCYGQPKTYGGTATYDGLFRHLVVTANGEEILDDHDDPATWSVGPIGPAWGINTVEVSLYKSVFSDHEEEDLLARDSFSYNSGWCESSEDGFGADATDSGGSESDSSDELTASTQKPAVKGAKTAKKAVSLKPLNQVFRTVFGRNPTLAEWNYWAKRMLGDKPGLLELLGAMQWHQQRGLTVGS